MKKNYATMSDIAKKLGISTVSVSKALTDKEGLSDSLRQKIKQTAEEMGYTYNPLSKQMKSGITENIGVIISKKYLGDGNEYYWLLYEKLVVKINALNHYTILELLTLEDEKELVMPTMITKRKVDGLIILGQLSKSYLNFLSKSEIPLVFLDFYDNQGFSSSVTADNFYGSYEITNYLIKNGHSKIVFVGSINSTSSIMDRYLGFLRALLTNNLDADYAARIEDRDSDGKYIDIVLPPKSAMPTAFVCNNDDVAAAVIKKLNSAGYSVPDDISVVGFDNFNNNTNYNITTVEVDLMSMAGNAADTIVKKIKNASHNPGRQFVACKLVTKGSVKTIR